MQVTTMKSLNKAELRFNTLEVTKDILNTLRTPFPNPCLAPNCKTGCTNTLFGKLATTTTDVDITTIKSYSDTTPDPDISAKTDFEVKDPIEELPDYKKILLDSIKFEGKGDKGTLKIFYRLESDSGFKIPIPSPLNIKILTVDDKGTATDTTDDTIKTCEVVSLGGIGGGGADCYKVTKDGHAIVGCNSTGEVTGVDAPPNNSTFFGFEAGKVSTAVENTFLGYKAGTLNTTGKSNTFVGHEAGRKVSGANDWNAYFGSLAGADATGNHNTYIGSHSGYGSTADTDNTGSNNTFVGINTGRFNTTGYFNTFIGSHAGYSNTTGYSNIFLGYHAGYSNTTGANNTFIGYYAGYFNTTGGNNIFMGYEAGYSNTTGANNTFIGYKAGYANTTGANNTFLGTHAGYFNTTGNSNTFLGYYAGSYNTTGANNTFLGTHAGYFNTTGNSNTFLGYYAGWKNTTGNSNTFLGQYAGYSNTTGTNNTFLGMNAGYSNTTGNYNTFLGYYAGWKNTTGTNNTFIGYYVGLLNTTGNYNTFLGYYAGWKNTTGRANTFLGRSAGSSNTTGENNIYIGHEIRGLQEEKNNQLQIGDWIKGEVETEGTGDSAVDKQKTLTLLSSTAGDKTADAEVVVEGSLRCTGSPCGGGGGINYDTLTSSISSSIRDATLTMPSGRTLGDYFEIQLQITHQEIETHQSHEDYVVLIPVRALIASNKTSVYVPIGSRGAPFVVLDFNASEIQATDTTLKFKTTNANYNLGVNISSIETAIGIRFGN